MRTVEAEEKDWKVELETFLRSYQNTLHSGINSSPAEVLYGRQWRNRLPDLMHTNEAYRKRMCTRTNEDERETMHPGGRLGVAQKGEEAAEKTEPFYELEPFRVIKMKESMISAENQSGASLETVRTRADASTRSAGRATATCLVFLRERRARISFELFSVISYRIHSTSSDSLVPSNLPSFISAKNTTPAKRRSS